MATDQWIVIRRWEDFQHRDAARANVPTWVKTFTKLLSDDDYRDLSSHRRAVLHGLWLEYARSTRRLRLDTRSLSLRLGIRVTTADIESLNHAGFLEFSASRPASRPAGILASTEEKRIEESREDQEQEDLAPASPLPPEKPTQLRRRDPIWDFLVSLAGEPLEKQRPARGRVTADLRALLLRDGFDDGSADELRRRQQALAREWGDAKATPRSLVNNWTLAGRLADGVANGNGKMTPEQMYEQAVQLQREGR